MFQSECGNRRYSITAGRMISGTVLKYRNGPRITIRGSYSVPCPASTNCALTVPSPAYHNCGTAQNDGAAMCRAVTHARQGAPPGEHRGAALRDHIGWADTDTHASQAGRRKPAYQDRGRAWRNNGPPTCGTITVTMGQTCISVIRAANISQAPRDKAEAMRLPPPAILLFVITIILT